MQTEYLTVTGMHRGRCVGAVSHALRAVPGVIEVDVSFDTGAVVVRHDEKTAAVDQLASAIKRAGYAVGRGRDGHAPARKRCCG